MEYKRSKLNLPTDNKPDTWVAVDKDGTEKISNNVFIRRCNVRSLMFGLIPVYYTKNQRNKWANMWSSDEKDAMPFCGVELPKGTIQKITGKTLTWEDEPIKI